ncbi:MAG: hypothetical protein WAM88_07170 [Nitrososphaeraceae archaeon]
MGENDKVNQVTEVSRANILILMDSFIEQITGIRKLLLGVSISALILAPFAIAIGLSFYLIVHPSFFAVLEIENEFGLVLSTLMGAVLVISSLWLVSGIKQYLSMGRWSKRYNEYIKAKEEMDRKIAVGYGLGVVSTADQ